MTPCQVSRLRASAFSCLPWTGVGGIARIPQRRILSTHLRTCCPAALRQQAPREEDLCRSYRGVLVTSPSCRLILARRLGSAPLLVRLDRGRQSRVDPILTDPVQESGR